MLQIIDGRDLQSPVHIPRPVPGGATRDPGAEVAAIVRDVRSGGDAALVELTKRFDHVTLTPDDIKVDPAVVAKARAYVRPEVVDALEVMAERLRRTCERQKPESWLDDLGDEMVGELVRPVWRAGIYA